MKKVKNVNILDLKELKKTKLNFFQSVIHPLNSVDIYFKIRRIPFRFLEVFNQESYLHANSDVLDAILHKEFQSALEHFILYGYDEVKNGKRRIGNEFPFMREDEYLNLNTDVKLAVNNHSFSSGFEHFLEFGYQEFHLGNRELSGSYPFVFSKYLVQLLEKDFDTKNYLETNKDVEKLIQTKKFSSAWDHFKNEGYEAVRLGKQQLYSQIPKHSEVEYVCANRDVFQALQKGKLFSPYEHFLLQGAKEILLGSRKMKNLYCYTAPHITENIKKEIEGLRVKPLISVIVPVYNVDAKWLSLAITSLRNQWYPHWEICVIDDNSTKIETIEYLKNVDDYKIKVVFLNKNVNISKASNEALKLVNGEYIALMDHDDELTPDALYEVVKVINEQGGEFIYSDEDKLEIDGKYTNPHFKADYAPDMFLSQNYISHLGVIKKSLVDKVQGWTVGLEGAQDYDLYLKVLEHTNKIVHIQKVLYHWRKIPGSTAAVFSDKSYAQKAGLKALTSTIKRRGIDAKVENGKYPGTYRVKYAIKGEPLVSIILTFKDEPQSLKLCLTSILEKSTYKNYEVIGMSNNSMEDETFQIMKYFSHKDERIKFYEYHHPLNTSTLNNEAVKKHVKGEHLILLNNHIEIISPEWIESMLEFSQQEEVGAVGGKLYYPNDTIQHAGVSIGTSTLVEYNFRNLPRDNSGYMGRESVIQNISAVTGSCLMVKSFLYRQLNGFNEKDLAIAFNDIDFCLRMREKGYLNIYTPYCEAYHYEFSSAEVEKANIQRFNREVAYIKIRHKDRVNQGDSYCKWILD
ncbi:MAG: glycosyltransferase [Campylobacterota bacterium]|nr:glycosyltransferase [Campylobacterota bacterium]